MEGLDAGADDYLPKPFALAELAARVRALTRRGSENKSIILQVADLTLDTVSHRAQRNGVQIELTAREYRLLEFLMRSAGRLCGRMMILEKVWTIVLIPAASALRRVKVIGGVAFRAIVLPDGVAVIETTWVGKGLVKPVAPMSAMVGDKIIAWEASFRNWQAGS